MNDGLYLSNTENGLCLQQIIKDRIVSSVQVLFNSKKNLFRKQFGGRFKETIAKAVGATMEHHPTIIDATAGLGTDAFVLASLGCSITLLEKSPVIYALLEDGFQRAQSTPELTSILQKMHLVRGDSIEYLSSLAETGLPEVIYLDPMFPERKKSALPKKEMQLLQQLLKNDRPDPRLLEYALQCALKRVVVKRPRLAPHLNERKPSFSYIGKSCRFDIYFPTHHSPKATIPHPSKANIRHPPT